MSVISEAVEALKNEFGEAILSVQEFRGQTTIEVTPEQLVECCRFLRDHGDLRFDRLSSVIGIDYWPRQPRFAVEYQLFSITRCVYLGLRILLEAETAEAPTLEGVYHNANWYEREVFDMFGIVFQGHSDLRRILLPSDWEGHPLRKDYPLGHEEVQFTFNYEDIQKHKKYARK
jgi:NADH-quinone oxidoreductase subunit C